MALIIKKESIYKKAYQHLLLTIFFTEMQFMTIKMSKFKHFDIQIFKNTFHKMILHI